MPAWADTEPRYIENKNQWRAPLQYVTRIPSGYMTVAPGQFGFVLYDQQAAERRHLHAHEGMTTLVNETGDDCISAHQVQLNFIGANPSSCASASGPSDHYYNFFLGDDAAHWGARAFAYEHIVYRDWYPGIDLKLYDEHGEVKYDFIVAPGADVSQIQWQYDGADQVGLDNGNLVVQTSLGHIIERKPYAYQEINGQRRAVSCHYVWQGDRVVLQFPEGYDACYTLVVDPLLIFSTYSGSRADNWGSTATPGEHGRLYSAGVTNWFVGRTLSGEFPATSGVFQTTYGGLYDIGILKYDSAGTQLLYATYLGGSQSESPHSLVMNASEELIVLGTTSSTDFPTTAGAFDRSFNGGDATAHVVEYQNGSDMVVARISADGTRLLASTYLGGSDNDGLNESTSVLSRNYGDQLRGDVITDADGNIYISSVTASEDFPVRNSLGTTYNDGLSDALVMKLPPSLADITWAAFLGGSDLDASHTIKLDDAGNLYVAGGTTSADFPVTSGAYQTAFGGAVDGWLAHIKGDGSAIMQATFTGTSAYDQVYFLDLNAVGEVFVYGQTLGAMPVKPSGAVFVEPNSGQFLQKFDANLTNTIFSTVFGSGRGIPDISPTAFLVNDCNNIYMSGWGGEVINSNTARLTVTADALQRTSSGNDFYFIVLTDDASELLYATFLGGTQSQTHVDGGTSRFDKGGIVYHAVCSGCAGTTPTGVPASDFPTTANAWSRTNNSRNCNNAAFKFDLASLRARIQTNSIKLNMPGLNKVCFPDPMVFQNRSTGGETYEWDFGDASGWVTSDTAYLVHRYAATGRYLVKLRAVDKGTCQGSDEASVYVDVVDTDIVVQDDDDMCDNTTYQLKAYNGAQYLWTDESGTFTSQEAMPIVHPKDTTVYYVTVTEDNGCQRRDTVQLNVIQVIHPDFSLSKLSNCFSTPFAQLTNLTDSLRAGDQLYFDYGDGKTSEADIAEHHFEKDGVYTVKLVAIREFCVTEKTVTLPFLSLKIPNIITPGGADGRNDKLTIQFGPDTNTTPRDFDIPVSIVIYNRWGREVYRNDDYQYDWSADGLGAGVYYYEVNIDGHASCKSWVQVVK